MMKNNYSKSQIFLLEFIVVVLFFAICSTICISAFIKADRISKDSSRDVNALVLAQNAAECFKASESADPAEYLKINDIIDGNYIIYYNEEFDAASRDNAAYTLKINIAETDENMMTAGISVYEGNRKTSFYNLKVDKYIGERN